jgi:hypothetical protein
MNFRGRGEGAIIMYKVHENQTAAACGVRLREDLYSPSFPRAFADMVMARCSLVLTILPQVPS